MASATISALSTLSADKISTVDVIPIVNDNETKKVSVGTLKDYMVSAASALAAEAATSAELASVDARITSADTALSATLKADAISAISVHSALCSAEDKALSDRITSANDHASAASAAATSAEAAAKSAANAVSVQVHADLVSADTVLSGTLKADAVSAIAVASAALDGKISTLSDKVVSVSAQLVSADAKTSAVSALAIAASAAAAAVSAAHAALSAVGDSYTWCIKTPAAGRIPGPKIYANQTVKKISGNTVSADTTMTYNVEKTVSINAAGSNLMSDNQTASVNAADTTTIVDATLTANSYLALSIASVSGSPTYGTITVIVTKP